MFSLRLHGPRDFKMHDEPVPQPGQGEVQIQIKSVGVCASDLHYYREGRIGSAVVTDPIIIGHEASGVITALGENVADHFPLVKVGDRVAIDPSKPCGKCEYCKSGHFNVCPNVQFFGTPPVNGCLCEYIVWPANLVEKVSDSVSFDEAAMVEPLAVGVYAVSLADIKPGCTVAIFGAGAVGLSVLQAAKVAGAGRIIVSEPVAARRELALKLGAEYAFDPSTINPNDEFARLSNGRGVDVVFECAGQEEAIRNACHAVRILGRMVIVGIPDSDVYPFEAATIRRKQATIIFDRRSNGVTGKSVELLGEGKVNVASYATHHFPLEKTAEAMELAISKADGVVRAIIAVS